VPIYFRARAADRAQQNSVAISSIVAVSSINVVISVIVAMRTSSLFAWQLNFS
jgi:hypothetical protein